MLLGKWKNLQVPHGSVPGDKMGANAHLCRNQRLWPPGTKAAGSLAACAAASFW